MNRDKYFNLFDSHEDYISAKNNLKKPNISYCEDVGVLYNPWTWEEEYLTTEALESGTISFEIGKNVTVNDLASVSYSKDSGETWTTTENTSGRADTLTISVSVVAGDNVIWKGSGDRVSVGEGIGSYSRFGTTGNINVKGNIMSLIYGDDYKGQTDLSGKIDCFTKLFTSSKVVSAENLSLPAMTLEEDCYKKLFSSCGSLVTAPKLPATTLATNCYNSIFDGCTSLTSVPELPATTLASGCYSYMFSDCSSLVEAPELPALTLADNCYNGMFSGCSGLIKAPRLIANELEMGCYSSMFADCTSLVVAPKLPATVMEWGCYTEMFVGCTSLVEAPQLPAMTLEEDCYGSMFMDCTSLVKAPDLPATVLANYCYMSMFFGCTSLNYIKVMATSINRDVHLGEEWMGDVPATGTFVRNKDATWPIQPNYGIVPRGWTVINE